MCCRESRSFAGLVGDRPLRAIISYPAPATHRLSIGTVRAASANDRYRAAPFGSAPRANGRYRRYLVARAGPGEGPESTQSRRSLPSIAMPARAPFLTLREGRGSGGELTFNAAKIKHSARGS